MDVGSQCITSPTRALLLRLLTLALALATAAAEQQDQCDGPVLRLLVGNSRYAPPHELYGVLATFGGVPSLNLSQPVQLLAAEPLDACAPLQQAPPGAVFLVERGNCSFTDKYAAAVAAGGGGMLLYDNVPGCITMGGVANGTNSSSPGSNGTQPAARNASDPAAVSLLHDDGVALLGELRSGGRLTLQWQLLDVPALDASALLLWLLAVGTVAGGALWCGSDYAAELKGWPPSPEDGGWQQQHGSGGGSSSHHTGGGGLEVLEITTLGACGFVAVSSGMLLLLYFFMSKVLLWVILFGFAAAGAQALTLLLLPATLAAAPRLAARSVVLPAWCGRCCGGGGDGSDGAGLEVGLAELLVAPLAVATAVVWAVCRNASWSWTLQDLLGVAIMLLVLRTLRLPNLRVACVLLPLCFAYDVFWVFLQPLLSGPGSSSVMVEVASGAGSSEFLPMLLRVPRLSGPPIIRGAYSLLGFGDVILPGLLVALTRRLDILMAAAASSSTDAAVPAVDAGSSSEARAGCCSGGSGGSRHGGYFCPAVAGYAAGLLLTYAALMFSWFGDQGQPALLYLVPCTLGVVLLLATCRGELRELMHVALEPADEELQVDAGAAGEPGSDWEDGDDGAAAASSSERVALLASAPASTSGGGSASGRQQRGRRVAAPGPVAEGVLRAAWWPRQQQQQQCDWGGTPPPSSQQEQQVSRLPHTRSRSSIGSRDKQHPGCSDLL